MKLKSYPGYAIETTKDTNNKVQLSYEANWVSVLQNFQSPSVLTKNSKAVLRDKEERVLFVHERKPQTYSSKNNFTFTEEWYNKSEEFTNPIQNNWHSVNNLRLNHSLSNNSKIRRSQTVIVKQPTFSKENETIDEKNEDQLSQRKNIFIRKSTFANAESIKEKSKLPINDSNKRYESCFDEKDENKKKENESLYRNIRDNPFTIKSYEECRHNTYNRMRSYETANVCTQDLQKHTEKIPLPSKNLLNPLARNKSININRFATADTENLGAESEKKNKPEKKNGLSKLFYNTISVSKLPKMFLKQSKNRETESDLLDVESNSLPATTSFFSRSKSDELRLNTNFTVAKSSNEMFVIPRPRLIVPVHTYSRKRRTGNLSHNKKCSDENNKSRKGNH